MGLKMRPWGPRSCIPVPILWNPSVCRQLVRTGSLALKRPKKCSKIRLPPVLPSFLPFRLLPMPMRPPRRIRTTTQNVNSNLTMEGGGVGKDDSNFEAALPRLLEEAAISQLLPQSVSHSLLPLHPLPTYCFCVGSGSVR